MRRRRRERQEDDVALAIAVGIWLLIVGMSWWVIAVQPWLVERGWL